MRSGAQLRVMPVTDWRSARSKLVLVANANFENTSGR
jgi:hypothetical protein